MTNDEIPAVQVLRGGPDEVDLAALTAVLSAYQAAQSAAPASEPARPDHRAAPVSAWSSRARGLRPPVHPGPGAWRWSRP
ncbi:acyl-CoA carboxylase subunit epsilon [Bogoriella caseilytica]|uniref:Acyl-CoA carboxylase epsilon subunit-like protein n=1 Tax=Bogoriella caseilytica TaxID=56055 RepID=A0A3N2BAN8_9MICO|nr:acyl-CoA carboxylase subunit epsilon [Bogoriella caseilytica]ROR72134.1 acyl-CoA carboxylase epsilon subunit-like protein [Bogoriella caseilytica]